MLLALHHVHTKKILHRDIKAMNVFLDEKLDCKLGDFGVSKILDKPQEMTGTIIGYASIFIQLTKIELRFTCHQNYVETQNTTVEVMFGPWVVSCMKCVLLYTPSNMP